MKDSYGVDFHHGWLIQVTPEAQGFNVTCYSPDRVRLILEEQFPSLCDALYAAKQSIDRQLACRLLAKELRELYEAGRLSFEDWNPLHASLSQPLKQH